MFARCECLSNRKAATACQQASIGFWFAIRNSACDPASIGHMPIAYIVLWLINTDPQTTGPGACASHVTFRFVGTIGFWAG